MVAAVVIALAPGIHASAWLVPMAGCRDQADREGFDADKCHRVVDESALIAEEPVVAVAME